MFGKVISKSTRVFMFGIAALMLLGFVGVSILGSSAQTGEERTGRLSINPYGVFLDGGAKILMSGFEAPVRLPANAGVPNISFGFTIPNDYVPTTPLIVELLWETPDTGCSFVFGSNYMFRAAEGQNQDLGNPSGGFKPLDASTEFTLNEFTITTTAPEAAHKTAQLRFEIRSTAGEFDSLLAGDAVSLSLGRLDKNEEDTCQSDVGIAGISVIYSINP